jgi:hypothetical protein
MEAVFFPLPFGWPGLRFSETPALLWASAAWGTTEVEAAAAAFAARASKVLLLWLAFGRPHFRDAEGALTSSLLPSGTLSLLAAEPLEDDIIGPDSERKSSS